MTKVAESLQNINNLDHHFVGTITLKSEEIRLPDGTKMALGIDGAHWVLIYQKDTKFKVYKYIQGENSIFVDHKEGNQADLVEFKQHINYFMANANTEQLVTYLPPK
ncbi:MAG: hypothetical protein ABIH69_07830 [bacterium]